MGAAERAREERLRCLGGDEAVPRDRLDHAAPFHPLERVRHAEYGNHGVVAFSERTKDALDDRVVQERSRGVVDDDDERIVRHLGERQADGPGARRTSGDTGDDLRRRELLRQQDRGLLPADGRDDDDRVDPGAAVQAVEALRE